MMDGWAQLVVQVRWNMGLNADADIYDFWAFFKTTLSLFKIFFVKKNT